MVDQSRRDRVGLGLIGLGPSWELLYRSAIDRLQNRLTVRLVYDTVEARALSVAGDFKADHVGSLHQLLHRSTLQGLLILDPGWLGTGALELIARSGKPVYLAVPSLRHGVELHRTLQSQPRASSAVGDSQILDDRWMPELRRRFTPASCRLRELIATRLGPVQDIRIECNLEADTTELAQTIDWCADLMGQVPVFADEGSGGQSGGEHIHFVFSKPPYKSSPRTASLHHSSHQSSELRCDITCVRGTAKLWDRARISWQNSHESADECLDDERSEIEILIDQFCRRALGGLNPVGRLDEFSKALRMVEFLSKRRKGES